MHIIFNQKEILYPTMCTSDVQYFGLVNSVHHIFSVEISSIVWPTLCLYDQCSDIFAITTVALSEDNGLSPKCDWSH